MAFAAQARGDQLDPVQALYAGDLDRVPGLDLTTDLKWELLTSLVAGGRADETQIDTALSKDDTATGALAAAKARAALPTPEAKQRAWDQIVAGELSNSTQRSVVLGFNRVHDQALLHPYVEAYFEQIDQLWASRSHEMAETAAVGLFPGWSVTAETVRAAEAARDATEFAGLRRVLLEATDDLHRALNARRA